MPGRVQCEQQYQLKFPMSASRVLPKWHSWRIYDCLAGVYRLEARPHVHISLYINIVSIHNIYIHVVYTYVYLYIYIYVYICKYIHKMHSDGEAGQRRGTPSAAVDSDSEHCMNEYDTWQPPRHFRRHHTATTGLPQRNRQGNIIILQDPIS